MAVNRYVQWAKQPVVDMPVDYLQQTVPLPFNELMEVGRQRQDLYNKTDADRAAIMKGLELEGLKTIYDTYGNPIDVSAANYNKIEDAKNNLLKKYQEWYGRDLTDPQIQNEVRQTALEYAGRVAPTGDLGIINENAKRYKQLRESISKIKDPQIRQGRMLDLDRQFYDFASGGVPLLEEKPVGEAVDINKDVQEGLKGMDPELAKIYAIQENPDDPDYIRVREGMRSGVYDSRIRSAFRSFWDKSNAKRASEGQIQDDIYRAQIAYRNTGKWDLRDSSGKVVSPEEYYNSEINKAYKDLENYAVQLYKQSSGKENLSIQAKPEFLSGSAKAAKEAEEVIPVQTIKGNAFNNPFMEGLPEKLPITELGSSSDLLSSVTGAARQGSADRFGRVGTVSGEGQVSQKIGNGEYLWQQVQALGLDPKYAGTLGPVQLQSGFFDAKTDAERAKVAKKVIERWNSLRSSMGVINDQIRIPSPEIQKDKESVSLGDRDDNNMGTLGTSVVYDAKFGKEMPFNDWKDLIDPKSLKDLKSGLKFNGYIRPYTGDEVESWSYKGREIRVKNGTMERNAQMQPGYNAIGKVKYGNSKELKNQDFSGNFNKPPGTVFLDVVGEDIWDGNKHLGRRVLLRDPISGETITEEDFNKISDRGDVYFNPFTQGATKTGGIDPKLKKGIRATDSGK